MKNKFEVGVFDCSEDEMNNFWIDMYVAERDYKKQLAENKGKPISAISPVAGKTVTVTITKQDFR